jgi:carbonic anhydrase
MDIIYRYDPFQPLSHNEPADADAALKALGEGNERFAGIVAQMQRETLGEAPAGQIVIPVCPLSLGLPFWKGAATTQAPFALVLGCSDARVPVELIFDQAFNDLFVVRIAGNVLGVECLGSIDYAVRHLGKSLKLVLVLGHSSCGAVTAAVDTYLNVGDYPDIAFTHALRSLVDRILIAVRGAAKALERVCGREIVRHPDYRSALLEATVYLNAAVTAFDLRREIAALDGGGLRVAYSVYDLFALRVHATPPGTGVTPPMFGAVPERAEDFIDLGTRLAKCIVDRGALP